jgi:hypothetical protein
MIPLYQKIEIVTNPESNKESIPSDNSRRQNALHKEV